ncbi:MAG: tetratricopeptide repeat protein [Rhodocyclaceae bacterium]|nr:tetratricopeptide repeat protein [Rhodocyclaceae bacterium]
MKFKAVLITLAAVLLVPNAWAANAAPDAANTASLIAQGDQQWAAKKLEDAKASFEQAVAASPRSVEARMKLGGFLLANSKYSAAIQTYQQAISLDGNNVKAWMGLGMAYLHSGDKELSRAAFSEVVRIEPARRAQLAKLMEAPAE